MEGNRFQNRSVSSPAPVTTVWPSGDMARYSTLGGRRVSVEVRTCEGRGGGAPIGVAGQRGQLAHRRVLPHDHLVQREAVGRDDLVHGPGPGQVAHLGAGVHGVEQVARIDVPELDVAVSGAAARGNKAWKGGHRVGGGAQPAVAARLPARTGLVRRPRNGLHRCLVGADPAQRRLSPAVPNQQLCAPRPR